MSKNELSQVEMINKSEREKYIEEILKIISSTNNVETLKQIIEKEKIYLKTLKKSNPKDFGYSIILINAEDRIKKIKE
ncbi:hypothetical protein HY750_02550 [Candidatus Kuenenbacteria bacterium]|nr:hypothetical protein [Candidatus Kuenenbacteria bacterium]